MGLSRRALFALSLLCAALIGLVVVSAATLSKTPGIPHPPPTYRSLPPTGGLPEESLRLSGKLVCEDGVYKLEVTALPGYVVNLRFGTSDVEIMAAAQLGQQVTVSGQWDSDDPTVFVVESIAVS